MKRIGIRVVVVSAVVTSLLIVPPAQYGCGPYFPVAIFTYSAHPDLPLKNYARGQLGILQPTYRRKYLYMAYRNLDGPGFTPAEVKELEKERRDESFTTSVEMANRPRPATIWFVTRNQVPDLALPDYIQNFQSQIPGYRQTAWEFYSYDNCLENSYETATKTLGSRIRQFGIESAEVRDWVQAQDRVFAHCGGWWGEKPDNAPLPEKAKATDAPLIRADRAYQIAAAQFYSNLFDVARESFERIAADETSPWHTIAPLLMARCLIRKATWANAPDQLAKETLQLARAQLEKVIQDPKQSEYHRCARGLLDHVAAKLDPEKRLREIAGNLMRRNIQENLEQDLTDFTFLLDKVDSVDVNYEKGVPYEQQVERANERKLKELGALRAGNDLLDWVLTFQAPGDSELEHSVQQWRKTKSLPWLVAALTRERAGNPEAAGLLAAAEKLPPNSSAYFSVTFHRLRLLAEKGQPDRARTELDTLFARRKSEIQPSALNLFKALRMQLAQGLDEFLRFAPRVPATTTFNEDGSEPPGNRRNLEWGGTRRTRWNEMLEGRAAVDSDAAAAFNEKLPLQLLLQSAKSELLPAGIRRDVAVAAWVKAVLLENDGIAAELAPILSELAPELKANLTAYQTEKTPEARRFAAVFAMLHFPGLRPLIDAGVGRDVPFEKIDSYRDNWWCGFVRRDDEWYGYDRSEGLGKPLKLLYPEEKLRFPAFLSAEEKEQAKKEWVRQEKVSAAPNYLSKEVIEWAKQHPQDPRLPEALHLAVRSTRYGCQDKESAKYSKAAFLVLHRKYSKSEWTQKTKYWFSQN